MVERVFRVDEIRLPGATAARLYEVNPIPGPRELVVETDTRRAKIGDGFRNWRDLEYAFEVDYSGGGGTSDPRVGNMNNLTTEAKTSIVDAINETNSDGVDYVLLYENAKAG